MIFKRVLFSITVALTCCLSLWLPVTAAGEVPVSVNCSPQVDKGSYFVATIEIGEVSNLFAAEFILEFDPDIISLESTGNGYIGGVEFPVNINQTGEGRYKVLGFEIGSTYTGEGTIATLNFYALESGSSSISMSNGLLSDTLEEIPSTWTNGSVTIPSEQQDTGGQSQAGTTGSDPQTTPDEETPAEETDPSAGTDTGESVVDDTAEDEEAVVITTSYDDEGEDSGIQIIQETKSVTLDEAGEEIVSETTTDSGSMESAEPVASGITAEGDFKWPILGGIIGGAVVIIGLIIYANRNKGYLG